MTDLPQLANDYGLAGIIIAILLAAVAALWRRLNDVQDKRIEDWKQQSAQVAEITKSLDRAMNILGGRNGGH